MRKIVDYMLVSLHRGGQTHPVNGLLSEEWELFGPPFEGRRRAGLLLGPWL
jgi:hypothetical protein